MLLLLRERELVSLLLSSSATRDRVVERKTSSLRSYSEILPPKVVGLCVVQTKKKTLKRCLWDVDATTTTRVVIIIPRRRLLRRPWREKTRYHLLTTQTDKSVVLRHPRRRSDARSGLAPIPHTHTTHKEELEQLKPPPNEVIETSSMRATESNGYHVVRGVPSSPSNQGALRSTPSRRHRRPSRSARRANASPSGIAVCIWRVPLAFGNRADDAVAVEDQRAGE